MGPKVDVVLGVYPTIIVNVLGGHGREDEQDQEIHKHERQLVHEADHANAWT